MEENGGNNYYYNNYDYNKAHNQLDPHVSLAGTALVLALISIPLCFFLNAGVVLGGIAICLALLSKGQMEKYLPQAKKAILFGAIGVVLGYGILAYDIHALMTDSEYRRMLNEVSEQMNGVSFDDMLKDLGVELKELPKEP